MAFKPNCSYHDSLCSTKTFIQKVNLMSKWVAKAKKELKFDYIVFTGISGASIAWPVCYKLKIPAIVVRKPGEKSHGYPVEGVGANKCKKYIIIDDFISSGNTIRKIIDSIESNDYDVGKARAKCIGIFLHNSDNDKEEFHLSKPKQIIPVFEIKSKMPKNVFKRAKSKK